MFEKITKTLSGLAFIKYINSLIDYVNTSDIDATRIKGQLDISNIPPAGLDNVIKVDTVTDMLALTVDDVQNGDTVMIIGVTPPVQYQVVDDTKLGTMDAFQEYAAGTATKALADINGNNIHTTYGKLAGNNTWTGNNYWNGSAIFKANLTIRGSATTPGDVSTYLWLGTQPEGSEQTPSIARNKQGDLIMYAADYRSCYLRSGAQTSFASVYNSDGTVEFSSLNNSPWGKYTNANGLELTVNKTPTVNTDVSNKKYVDDSIADAVAKGEFLPLTGGTVTGPIYLPSTAPTTDTQAVTKKYVDDSVASAGGGSNLTTYTSLEQLGITPGQETFASIHSALPINSVLEYYVSEAQNFADIYPASYGNFIATRLTGDITIFHFTGTNQIIYVTHYHVTANTNPSWTQIAKQSDLTNLSNSVVKSVNGIKPTNGNVPNIARTDVANNFVTGQKFLKHPTVSGVGGQLFLEKPEVSTLAGDVVIDVMGEMLRFREKGGSGRGFNMNIASGAANCQSPIVTSVNGVKADYTGNIQLKNSNATPVGTILALLDDEVPEGYLPAEGAEISRTTYADLFNVIGTKFGEGDGSTTFNLPNLVGRFLEGDGVPGTLKEPGLPNITGNISAFKSSISGAFVGSNNTNRYGGWDDNKDEYAVSTSFDASRSNSIYGASDTVQPKSVTVKFCIKY